MMRTKFLFPLAVLLLMAMACSSCAERKLNEQELILLETVKRYNSRLRLAYLEVNLNHMATVATEAQISRLFAVFQALRVEEDYMRAEQEVFEVERVQLTDEGTGQVDTNEKWVFWWQDRQTNEITKPQAEVTYHMRYDLVLEDGVWKIDNLEDLDPEK